MNGVEWPSKARLRSVLHLPCPRQSLIPTIRLQHAGQKPMAPDTEMLVERSCGYLVAPRH